MKIRLLFLLFGVAHLACAQTPVARIARFAGDRAAAISYTFDDNLRDQYTLAVPMLNEVGFKGTFFVIPGVTAATPEEGEQKQSDSNLRKFFGGISWPELKKMADQGHEIASHTWSHRNLRQLPAAEVEEEFRRAAEAIQSHIGKPPLTLAFPFNQSTPEVQATALRYHVAYRAFQIGTGEGSTVASLNTWAEMLIRDKKWGILMAHGIAKGYAALSDPEILRGHLQFVKSREREVWVDTFANIARYEKERDSTQLTVTGKPGSVTCELRSPLDPQLYDVALTTVIDAPGVKTAKAERGGKPLPVRVEKDTIQVDAVPQAEPIHVTWQ